MEALARSQSYGPVSGGMVSTQALTKTTDCVSLSKSITRVINLESAVLLYKLCAPAFIYLFLLWSVVESVEILSYKYADLP